MPATAIGRPASWTFKASSAKPVCRWSENQAGSGDPLADFISKGAVQLFSAPAARLVESWAKQKVDDGAKEVQMPAAAVAGAMVLLHNNGSTAYTQFRDRKGQDWDIRDGA